MNQRFAIDNVTITIDKQTLLTSRKPLVTVSADMIGLYIGERQEVLLWVERSALIDLIGVLVDAALVKAPEDSNGQVSEVQAVPVEESVTDEIPF